MPTPETPGHSKLEIERYLMLNMIIWNLDAPRRSIAEMWHPPMTADGRQMKIALEVESLIRRVWAQAVPPKPPPFRSPLPSEDPVEHRRLENARADVLLESRSRLRAALGEIMYSDAIFEAFPNATHADIRRIRELMNEIAGEGLGLSPAP